MADAGGTLGWPEETVPVLRVSNAAESAAWYKRLGFCLEWEHRFEPNFPVFASIRRGGDGAGARLFLTEHTGGGVPFGSHVYWRVTDVDPVAAEFRVPVQRVDGPRWKHDPGWLAVRQRARSWLHLSRPVAMMSGD
jgi:catechol 2,3-dioxygenase-like lactoylglutathione lyase family enzyme